MPAYDYLEGGRRVTRVLPVAERDSFPNRITVPDRIMVCPRGEPTQSDAVLAGYKACEEKDGTEAIRRDCAALGLTRDQVKKAWAAPDPPGSEPL